MALSVFIDPSAILRLYSYSEDALAEVEKLTALAKTESLVSYVTTQSIEETRRNRDVEVRETLKKVETLNAPVQIPRFAEHLEESKIYLDKLKESKSARKALVDKIKEEISDESLRADKLIEDFFDASDLLERSLDHIESAKIRRALANPPGKNSSIGDQINWEILLSEVPSGTDLHVIARDKDYHGSVDGSVNYFLKKEWEGKKSAKVFVYDGLASFTKKHFPNIKIPSDAIRSSAITELISSGSFFWTHEQIRILNDMISDISFSEAERLLHAFVDNDQIHSIRNDEDVSKFYSKLYSTYYVLLDNDLDSALHELDDKMIFIPF